MVNSNSNHNNNSNNNNNNNNNDNNHKNAYQKRPTAIVSNEKSNDLTAIADHHHHHSIFGVHQPPTPPQYRWTNSNTSPSPPPSAIPFAPPLPSTLSASSSSSVSASFYANVPPLSSSMFEMAAEHPNPSHHHVGQHYHHHNHYQNQQQPQPQQHPLSSLRTANSNQSTNRTNHQRSMIYVYELPYNIRKSICDLLDADNSWRELGGRYMGFNDTQLTLISHALYRSASPTNELLTKWESSNAKISHLFMYLAQLKHHRAMYYLLPFVNHKLRSVYETAVGHNPSSMMATDHDHAHHHDHDDFPGKFLPNNLGQQPGGGLLLSSLLLSSSMNQEPGGRTLGGNHHHRSGLIHGKQSRDDDDDPKYYEFKDEHLRKSSEEKTLIDINKHHNHKNNNDNNDNNCKDHHDHQAKQSKHADHGNLDNLDDEMIHEPKQRDQENCPEYLLKIDDFKISYKELMIATDDFAKDNILGSGGFGTVFIGDWKGTKVAVKKLKGLDNLTQALTELRILNCCRIDNILPLYAVSLDGPEPCLVYQYMPNGSLEDRLLCKNNTPPLTWHQRARIGEGVARALNFLHTLKGNPFVHGDVKSANILLDPMFEPRLGDFGLARQVVKNSRNENSIYTHCTVTSVNGTSVYLPAEYLRQKILSPAVDVYSYGIVILEMATGRRAYNGKKLLINSVEDEYSKAAHQASGINSGHSKQQHSMIKATSTTNNINNDHHGQQQQQNSTVANEKSLELLMDKRIAKQTDGRHLFNYLLELGRRCAHKTKSKRPIMVQILEYFNQCRSTERIHRLCDKVIQNKLLLSKMSISKASIKNPVELQLWYDFVRKSCGTLSEVVFDNFDAQVTKIIEDLASRTGHSIGDESTYCLDLLLNTKNRNTTTTTNNNTPVSLVQPTESLANQTDEIGHPSKDSRSQLSIISTASSSSTSSMLNPTCKSFNNNNNNNNNDGETEYPPDSPESMGADQLSTGTSHEGGMGTVSTDGVTQRSETDHVDHDNDDGDGNDDDDHDEDHDDDEHDDDAGGHILDQDEQSGPLIPLLTALGFDRSKFDELIEE